MAIILQQRAKIKEKEKANYEIRVCYEGSDQLMNQKRRNRKRIAMENDIAYQKREKREKL